MKVCGRQQKRLLDVFQATALKAAFCAGKTNVTFKMSDMTFDILIKPATGSPRATSAGHALHGERVMTKRVCTVCGEMMLHQAGVVCRVESLYQILSLWKT